MADYAIGDRVRELRSRRGLKQEQLAEAAGLHINVIKKIESGGTARMESYHAIARALGVVTMLFVPPPSTAPEPEQAHDARDVALADMRSAISPPMTMRGPVYRDELDEGPPDLQRLNRAVRYLVEAYHGDHYDDVAQLAPGLIRSAHYHVDAVEPPQRSEAVRLRGDVLGVTGRYLIQVRAHDLALMALRDALRDAIEVSDQNLAASIMGSQAWVMLRQARFAEVERLCARAADELEPRLSAATPDELASWGWMLVRASSAAARNNRPEEAREYLSLASAAAARVGSEIADLSGHVTFGPLTVAIKGPENELIAGRPDKALELTGQLPRGGGKTNASGWQRHLVDRARALTQTGRADRATEILSELRRQAPAWLQHQRYAQDTVRDILDRRVRPLTEDQRTLVEFLRIDS